MGNCTWRWLLLLFYLALGIGACLLTAVVVWSFAEPCFGCGEGRVEMLLLGLAALLVMPFGLAWMIRIIRGPRDTPPRWGYRDR